MKKRVKYRKHFSELRDELEGKKRKITQQKLGELLGISASAISDLERGKREATTTELRAYHRYFNVPVEYLMGLSESRMYSNTDIARKLGFSDNAIKLFIRSKEMNLNIVELINELCDTEDGFKFMQTLFQYLHSEPFLFIDPSSKKEEKYLNEIMIRNTDDSVDSLDVSIVEELRINKLSCLIRYLKNPIKIEWPEPERKENTWHTFKLEKILGEE